VPTLLLLAALEEDDAPAEDEDEDELGDLEALSASLPWELLTCAPDLSSTGTSLSFTPEAQAASR
jgi:hypothetical protein